MGDIDALLERAFMCLEDGNFAKADELLEQALNLNFKSSKIYIGKLMVELKVRKESEIQNYGSSLTPKSNFKRAFQFADQEYRDILMGYNQNILERKSNLAKVYKSLALIMLVIMILASIFSILAYYAAN